MATKGLYYRRNKERCICPKFKRILKKNNLPNVRFHDLRHSHASLLLEQGTHLKAISDRLGHSTISITADTYTHVNDCVNQELADNFDNLLSCDQVVTK